MAETLLALLTAHLLADFVFSSDVSARPATLWTVLRHAGIAVVASFLMLGSEHAGILATVFVVHLISDVVEIRLTKSSWRWFAADQMAHLAVLILLSSWYDDAASDGWWPRSFRIANLPWFYGAQCLVAGFIATVPVGGILIKKLTASISAEVTESRIVVDQPLSEPPVSGHDYLTTGLTNGGKYIGWLERLLTMILILIGHPTGIGFLVAAKSILRFGEIKESRHRKLAEYIIIGTFLSFAWALLMSTLTQKGLTHWLPATAVQPQPIEFMIKDSGLHLSR